MSNIATLNTTAHDFNGATLSLIRRTSAADTTEDEFNLFIAHCRALQLDPRRRQIYALVYNKDKPAKRRMSIIVGIDGFRSVAARSGCYRPDEEEPRFEIDPALKSSTNPLGLVKATVRIHQFSHGQWFPVTGTAYWDEFAPIKEEWGQDETGSRRPTGKKAPDGKWATMPRLMLAKCAEAQALRKGWPEDFSNVYAPEEMDQASMELLPSEAVAKAETEDRVAKIGGGNALLADFLDGMEIQRVGVGNFADKVMEFIEQHREEPSQIALFQTKNRHALREFWARAPGDALEIKKALEAAVAGADDQP